MIDESLAYFEVAAGTLLMLYPIYTKPLPYRMQQLILLTVCLGCSASIARRTEIELLWFALAYAAITVATFFVPMLSVVIACVTTTTALLGDSVAWYFSVPASLVVAFGIFASPDFVKNWQVWLLPALAAVLVCGGLRTFFTELPMMTVLLGVYAIGCGLQLNKLKRNFDSLQKEAEAYKENHYKMFEEGSSSLLAACQGDQEQLERVLFGAGLY